MPLLVVWQFNVTEICFTSTCLEAPFSTPIHKLGARTIFKSPSYASPTWRAQVSAKTNLIVRTRFIWFQPDGKPFRTNEFGICCSKQKHTYASLPLKCNLQTINKVVCARLWQMKKNVNQMRKDHAEVALQHVDLSMSSLNITAATTLSDCIYKSQNMATISWIKLILKSGSENWALANERYACSEVWTLSGASALRSCWSFGFCPLWCTLSTHCKTYGREGRDGVLAAIDLHKLRTLPTSARYSQELTLINFA